MQTAYTASDEQVRPCERCDRAAHMLYVFVDEKRARLRCVKHGYEVEHGEGRRAVEVLKRW